MDAPKPTTLFLCGPMTGLPDYNYPAFNHVAAKLRAAGFTVLNPAENPESATYSGYLRMSIAQLVQADAVALLPGSGQSRGAGIEIRIARDLEIPALPWNNYL